MYTLMHEGGFPMWFVLLFGLITLGAAIRFAYKADRRQLGFLIGMSLATLFSIIGGTVAAFAAVGHHLAERWEQYQSQVSRIVAQGSAEAMSAAVLGFTLLSLTWLIAAVGLSRSSRLSPA